MKGIYFVSCLYFLNEFTLLLKCLENFCFLFYFFNSIQFSQTSSHHNGDENKKKTFSKNLIKALPHRAPHLEVHNATKFDLIGTLTQTDRPPCVPNIPCGLKTNKVTTKFRDATETLTISFIEFDICLEIAEVLDGNAHQMYSAKIYGKLQIDEK